MPYQVDIWAGDLHQRHIGCETFDEWAEAAIFMQQHVDAGLLCNILHTDFKAPMHRVDEQIAALAKILKK